MGQESVLCEVCLVLVIQCDSRLYSFFGFHVIVRRVLYLKLLSTYKRWRSA